MDRPHLSWAVPLVLTTPLLVSGGIVIHASLAWTIRSEVGLAAETVDGVSFFVWIPRPSQAMRVAAVTPDAAYDLVETPFGTMGNLSGVRFASVRYE